MHLIQVGGEVDSRGVRVRVLGIEGDLEGGGAAGGVQCTSCRWRDGERGEGKVGKGGEGKGIGGTGERGAAGGVRRASWGR